MGQKQVLLSWNSTNPVSLEFNNCLKWKFLSPCSSRNPYQMIWLLDSLLTLPVWQSLSSHNAMALLSLVDTKGNSENLRDGKGCVILTRWVQRALRSEVNASFMPDITWLGVRSPCLWLSANIDSAKATKREETWICNLAIHTGSHGTVSERFSAAKTRE